MGATDEQGGDEHDDEHPVHTVQLDDFRISRYPVTQEEWIGLMGNQPSYFQGQDNLPVERISWMEARQFIAKLNSLVFGGYRLPTEAEWEYAARGGRLSKGFKYSGGNEVDEVGWIHRNSDRSTHPVGLKKPNELGLYDMSGNVMEWCQDWFSHYPIHPRLNPSGPKSGQWRVMRGGCFCMHQENARVSARSMEEPDSASDLIGFRLVFQR
jgi:formylglycine-generating enzyme required for sulfatase activity